MLRTDRRDRRLRGKNDPIDAENAARAVLAGQARAVPKTADGTVEMIRQIKVAKDIAVKARTSAMISLKAIVGHRPARAARAARAADQDGPDPTAAPRCGPAPMSTRRPPRSTPCARIARRWLVLDDEIKTTSSCSTG